LPQANAVAPAAESVILCDPDVVLINPTIGNLEKFGVSFLYKKALDICANPIPSPTIKMMFGRFTFSDTKSCFSLSDIFDSQVSRKDPVNRSTKITLNLMPKNTSSNRYGKALDGFIRESIIYLALLLYSRNPATINSAFVFSESCYKLPPESFRETLISLKSKLDVPAIVRDIIPSEQVIPTT